MPPALTLTGGNPKSKSAAALEAVYLYIIKRLAAEDAEEINRWLASVLATPKGGRHKVLGKYVSQDDGRAGWITERCAVA
jgi:hypothetical protein